MGGGRAQRRDTLFAIERHKYYDSHIGKHHIGRLHRVHIGQLSPNTTYRYRIMQQGVICDEGNKQLILGEGNDILNHKINTATTLDTTKEQVEFWVVNDIHAQDSIFRLLMKGVDKSRPDFVCFNGAMLSAMESEKQLSTGYLQSASKLLTSAGIPIVATRGNHENRGKLAKSESLRDLIFAIESHWNKSYPFCWQLFNFNVEFAHYSDYFA